MARVHLISVSSFLIKPETVCRVRLIFMETLFEALYSTLIIGLEPRLRDAFFQTQTLVRASTSKLLQTNSLQHKRVEKHLPAHSDQFINERNINAALTSGVIFNAPSKRSSTVYTLITHRNSSVKTQTCSSQSSPLSVNTSEPWFCFKVVKVPETDAVRPGAEDSIKQPVRPNKYVKQDTKEERSRNSQRCSGQIKGSFKRGTITSFSRVSENIFFIVPLKRRIMGPLKTLSGTC